MMPKSSKNLPRLCVPKRLLERDRDAGNGVPVPRGAEDHVGEAQRYQVLDHLLAKVMVDPVELVLAEEFLQVQREICRAVRVLSKGFLHDDPGPASGSHTSSLEHSGDRFEDAGRQCEIEESVAGALLM